MILKSVSVKICGITNLEDALWAANLGADFVGLNFYSESPRKVSLEKAKEIRAGLPKFIKVVGVFVDPELSFLKKTLDSVSLNALQFHGDEPGPFLEQVQSEYSIDCWKALRVKNETSLQNIPDYSKAARVILIDSYQENQFGGTGENCDWKCALKAKDYGIPIFLAGGLTPDNVLEAIKKVQPNGVDVASGVEKIGHPRKKDMEKLKCFIQRAKGLST